MMDRKPRHTTQQPSQDRAMPRPAPHRAPAARTEHLVQRYSVLGAILLCTLISGLLGDSLLGIWRLEPDSAHPRRLALAAGQPRPDVPYRDDCAVRRRGVDRFCVGRGVVSDYGGLALAASPAVGARSPSDKPAQRCPTWRRSPGSPAHRSSPSTGRSLGSQAGRPVYVGGA